MENNLTYTMNGDYMIPDLKIEVPEQPLGKYGRMRQKYLKEHRPILWNQMILEEALFPHLLEIEQAAQSRLEQMMPKLAAEAQEAVRHQYDEPAATVKAEKVEAMGGMAMSTEDSKKVAEFLCDLPNGVQAMSREIQGLVQTSLNLGIAKVEEETLVLTFSVRSSVNGEKAELLDRLQKTAEKYGGTMEIMGAYPAWEYRKDSPLRDLMCTVYREQFGKEPEIQAIHAGLECGLLSDKLPGLDCVSFGPEMADIHTSREKLNIASVSRMWKYLLEILRRL